MALGAALLGVLLVGTIMSPVQDTPEAREARLAPGWRLLLPEGAGPHPVAILLSGCDGVHDNMAFWADRLLSRGRAAMIVDSHTARGLARDPAWRPVCAGLMLRGPRRAGDVAVALDALTRMPDVDASDVVLLGASHGAWTAMEFVRLANTGQTPPGLTGWPEPSGDSLERISALVLLYPYCGRLNGAQPENWQGAPPMLMILSQHDQIVSTPACAARAEVLRTTGAEVQVEVIANANHGFDQADKALLSTLPLDAAQRAQAEEAMNRFLDAMVR